MQAPAVDRQSRWMYFKMTMILINVTGRRNSFRSRIYLVDIGKRRLKVIPKVFPCQNVLEKHVFFSFGRPERLFSGHDMIVICNVKW